MEIRVSSFPAQVEEVVAVLFAGFAFFAFIAHMLRTISCAL